MNPEAEACIKCKVKCDLEKRSDKIIDEYKPGDGSKEVNALVSTMSQMANGIGCPPDEINKYREKTFLKTIPQLIKGNNAFLFTKKRPS